MSEDVNPNYDFVDDQVSDMHNDVVDALLEDGEVMGGIASGMGAEPTTLSMGGSVDSGSMGGSVDSGSMAAPTTAQVVSVPGSGSGMGGASMAGAGRR
ncbi:MAG: hypothetical protein PVG22_04540 [Chromatiales bacterium]